MHQRETPEKTVLKTLRESFQCDKTVISFFPSISLFFVLVVVPIPVLIPRASFQIGFGARLRSVFRL